MTAFEASELAYKNGYEQGKAEALKSIVRCCECKYRDTEQCPMKTWVSFYNETTADLSFTRVDTTEDEGYCHKGERK